MEAERAAVLDASFAIAGWLYVHVQHAALLCLLQAAQKQVDA
jgi:hypothetical protein